MNDAKTTTTANQTACGRELNNSMYWEGQPLEWADLWAAMSLNPEAWIPTTGAMYSDLMGAVPPLAIKHNRYLVGEPDHHNDEGRAVYACFRRVNGAFFARYLTASEFHKL